jgi:phosphate transport system protein
LVDIARGNLLVTTRERFIRQLTQLANSIMSMLDLVEEQLRLALAAYAGLNPVLGQKVIDLDKHVDRMRLAIEEQCLNLIALQQPAASDLRLVITAMNVIVDIERMGNQAKGIVRALKRFDYQLGEADRIPEIGAMGSAVQEMLQQGKDAFLSRNIDLASHVIECDHDIDKLYAIVYTQLTFRTAQYNTVQEVEREYELLRIARELERFADLVTNLAERTILLVRGQSVLDGAP